MIACLNVVVLRRSFNDGATSLLASRGESVCGPNDPERDEAVFTLSSASQGSESKADKALAARCPPHALSLSNLLR